MTGSNVDTDSTGNVLESIDYFPFGSVRVDSKVAGYENDYKYTGKELDTDTGLYYYGARYYNSDVGRFISTDPESRDNPQKFLTDPQQFNTYSYARNNPIILLDPDGKSAKTFFQGLAKGFVVGGAIALAIASAPVTIPTAVLTTAAYAGVALTGYGAYANYKAYDNGTITKDQFDHNSGELIGGLILPERVGKMGGAKGAGEVKATEAVINKSKIFTKNGIEINGFTEHAVDRAIGDLSKRSGVKTGDILDAIKNPLKINEVKYDKLNRSSQRFVGAKGEVVVSPDNGKIISVNPTSSAKAKSLSK